MKDSKNKLLFGILVSFLVGTAFGLVVLGWGVWPVQWYDAAPNSLRADLQTDYVNMAIDSYAVNKNQGLAQYRWSSLGPNAPAILDALEQKPGSHNPAAIKAFAQAIAAPTPEAGVVIPSHLFPAEYCESKPSMQNSITPAFIFWAALATIVSGVLTYVLFFKPRKNVRRKDRPVPVNGAAVLDRASLGAPAGKFPATYAVGDDAFDPSFQICTAPGVFMGECGVGVASTDTFRDCHLADAFVLWLLDRNERQMSRLILATPRAFRNEDKLAALEEMGEVVEISAEMTVTLRTKYLQAEYKVASVLYSTGSLPDGSVGRIVFDIEAWISSR